MPTVTLYGHAASGHACKVGVALRLADVAHRTIVVDINAPRDTRPADFLAANPAAEVPVLVVDDEPLVQSGAILHRIATMTGTLGGDDPAQMDRARALMMWEANRIGMCLPQLIAAPKDGFAPQVVDWLSSRYAVDRDRFDLYLGDADFFHGDAPGIADCAIWGYVQWVDRAGMTPSDAMAGWLDRMRALPQMETPEAMFPQ